MVQEINIYLGIVSNNEVLGKISQLNFFLLNLGGSGVRKDLSAFLFSLKNPTNDPRKLPHRAGGSYSMRDFAGIGPSLEKTFSLQTMLTRTVSPMKILATPTLYHQGEVETFYETTP